MPRRPVHLGPFSLGEVIGRGGMGTVFRAEHTRQGAPVAVKVVSAARARDAEYREAFQHEVRAVASLDHPAIVMVLDQGVVDRRAAEASGDALIEGSPYLVMELLDRGSLREHGPPRWSDLRRVLLELLDALAHAHARGFVHRDIKPSNVMLAAGDGPSVKLTDFGIVHAVDEPSAFRGASITGTPHYMAPEQVRAELRELGPWTDLYAVGCVAYCLASGRPPFFEPDLETAEVLIRQLEAPVPKLRSLVGVPPGFGDWIESLMEKDPRARFQCAADAVAALLSLPGAAVTWSADEATHVLSPDEPVIDDRNAPTMYTVGSDSTRVDLVPSSAPSSRSVARKARPAPFRPAWRAREAPARSTALLGAGLGLYGLRPIPMVDRDAERDALWAALGEVHAKRRPVLRVLRGASGVGKSRLAEWLGRRAQEVGAAEVLVATHDVAAGSGSGLGHMVSRALRTTGSPSREAVSHTIEALRPRGGSVEDAMTIAAFSHGEAIGPDPDGPRVRLASPRERLLAVTRLLELWAADRPVLLWLDDVQWGLEALELASHLSALPPDRELPVLVVLTLREEALESRPLEAARLEALEPAAPSIRVETLQPADHAELVARLLGLSGSVAAQVCDRTLGNPLFAVHLVGDWVQRGVLVAGDAGYELAQGADASIPDDIHELWLRRLSPLVDRSEGWFVLELAATLGGHVSNEEHRRACEAAGVRYDREWVSALVLRGLVREEPDGFSFVHAMLLESLVRHAAEARRSARAHLACADALQESRARGTSERIAHHLEAAGELLRALGPMLAASLERAQSSEYDPALALLDRWEATATAAGVPEEDPRRVRVWIERATILLRRARPKEAEPWVTRAESVVLENGWEDELGADVLFARAKHAQMAGLLHDGIATYEQALPLYEARGDHVGVARCRHGLASMQRRSGRRDEAIASFEGAIESYRRAGDEFGLSHCLLNLADVLIEMKQARGLEVLEEARDRAEAYGYRLGIAMVHLQLGLAYRYESKFEASIQGLERSAQILGALESTDVAVPRQNIGVVHLIQGHYATAREIFEDIYAKMKDVGRDGFLVFTHTALLPCYAHAREWARFDAHCSLAEACLERSGVVDVDLELALSKGAELCEAAGEPHRAARAHALAEAQRRALEAGNR